VPAGQIRLKKSIYELPRINNFGYNITLGRPRMIF
jgi:hypothetical protein